MTLVPDKRVEDNSDAQEAYNLTMQLKEKYPDLKGILGTGSFDAPGAARAIEEMGLTGEMFAISVAMPAEVSDYLINGTLKSVALWDASVTARVQLNTAMKLFKGEEVGEGADYVDGFLVEDLNEGLGIHLLELFAKHIEIAHAGVYRLGQ
jgi:simple sugar transport system substrate-binding protein